MPSPFAASSGLALLTHETASCLFKITIKIPINHQLKTVVRQNEYFDNGPKGPW
jgi:hypothetical protein